MTLWTLIRRSLRFHFRSHLGTVLGATIGSAVLCGALGVGDSVRISLREMALARLGNVELALASNDRFVRDRLATDLRTGLRAEVAPAIQLTGTAANVDNNTRANHVQILGVASSFWQLSGDEGMPDWDGLEGIVVNTELAVQLNLKPSDTVLLRVAKPSLLSRDVPLASNKESSVALRLRVIAVVSEAGMGRFSLRANQLAPFNAFVPLRLLQNRLDLAGRANLLLIPGATGASTKTTLEQAQRELRNRWSMADAELELRTLGNGACELRSKRVFLDPPAAERALATMREKSPLSLFTYFVNELRHGTNATPYSMVTAASAPFVPETLKDDEIVLNAWLAEDLNAKVGDRINLSYFVMRSQGKLEEQTNSFRVHSVVPLETPYADRDLMPDFPGLAKAESSQDWDTGFPIHLNRIRDKDELYWKQNRGTPKAFVSLKAGQEMWQNRFGNLTSIRFKAANEAAMNASINALQKALDPGDFGLAFQPVRAQALAASNQAQDFSQLFLGFSFFIIVAALLLMALLFQFGLEQRTREVGTLLALGFKAATVRRLLLGEGAVLAFFGAVLGVGCAMGYARAMLFALTTLWRDAVGTSSLEFHVTARTLAIGLTASVIVSVVTLWITLRGQARRAPHELLEQGPEFELDRARPGKKKRRIAPALAILAGIGGAALLVYGFKLREQGAAEIFFSSGALWLIAGLAAIAILLRRFSRAHADAAPSLTQMGIRASARLRKRSLATIALLASGSFLIVAVAAHRLNSEQNSRDRKSGTGGFALLAQSTLPLVQDLNEPAGRQALGLNETQMQGVEAIPFRVHEGDDASCLNLNRAQIPTLLGVNPSLLAEKHAFTFQSALDSNREKNPWLLLQRHEAAEIPAIADAASIQWALKKKVGDTIEYVDDRGKVFRVKIVASLANSILQGNLIIDEQALLSRFPSETGYRMFLIDAPSKRATEVAADLSRALQDYGFEPLSTTKRLAAFNAVQNTYLNTFQMLGGLGLLLGSAGLGVVVLRNVLERRGELGVLQAMGFRARSLRWLVLSEHLALLGLGLGLGIVSAGVAVLPGLSVPGAELPSRAVIYALAAVFGSGLLWTWLAARFALRGELLDALRNN